MKVNLLAWRQRALRRRLLRHGASGGMLLLVTLAALLLWRQSLAEEARQWRQRLTLWQAARQQAHQLAQRYAALQQQAQALEQQTARRLLRRQQLSEWQTLMAQLEASVPDGLWLSTLTHQQRALRIEGLSQRPEAARLLHQRLRLLPFLQPWRPGGLQKNVDGLYRFTLAAGNADEVKNEK